MDDYIWKKKMQERRARIRRERSFVLLLLVLSVGALLWYFAFYVHTPEYAAKKIEQALKEKDPQTFQEYTAMNLLLSDAYDDLTVDLFRNDSTLNPQTKVLFEKFYVLVKPQLTSATENIIYRKISTDAWEMPEGADILKGRQLGIDYEQFLERSLLKSTVLKEFGEVNRTNDTATLMLKVVEERSQTPFTLELTMEKDKTGHWQITCIKNYRSYLETVAPRIYQDIAAYIDSTAEIVKQCNEKFQTHQWDVQYISYSSGGQLNKAQRTELASYLEDHVIPTIKNRQQELDQIPIPPGAAYLAELRKESTALSIRVWQHYIHGLRDDNIAEFNTAETMRKQMLTVEQRIDDIIRHAAISEMSSNIP